MRQGLISSSSRPRRAAARGARQCARSRRWRRSTALAPANPRARSASATRYPRSGMERVGSAKGTASASDPHRSQSGVGKELIARAIQSSASGAAVRHGFFSAIPQPRRHPVRPRKAPPRHRKHAGKFVEAHGGTSPRYRHLPPEVQACCAPRCGEIDQWAREPVKRIRLISATPHLQRAQGCSTRIFLLFARSSCRRSTAAASTRWSAFRRRFTFSQCRWRHMSGALMITRCL